MTGQQTATPPRDALDTKVIALHQVYARGCNHVIEVNPRTTCQIEGFPNVV